MRLLLVVLSLCFSSTCFAEAAKNEAVKPDITKKSDIASKPEIAKASDVKPKLEEKPNLEAKPNLEKNIAEPAIVENKTPALTKEDVEKIVHDYIKVHPEVIVESVTNFQQQESGKELQNARNAAKEQIKFLNDDKDSPSVGAKDADVVLVEFFDYHCGYCKMQFAILKELLAEDKKIRVVFKEFPIFGEKSVELSQIALAIHRVAPDKYLSFHQRMMEAENANGELAWQVAKELGISEVALKKEAASKEVQNILDKTHELAKKMGIRGTPALFVNGEPYLSAAKKDKLQELIIDARKNLHK